MNERKLTKSELAKREDIIMKMKKNKRALTQKYGKDAEAVMYGRATNLAKKQAEGMDQDKIKELVKDALQNPNKADLNKDGKLSDYEKKRGAAIEKSMTTVDESVDENSPIHVKTSAGKDVLVTDKEEIEKFHKGEDAAGKAGQEDFLVNKNDKGITFKAIEKIDEMDLNDPIAMKLRADKDKLAKMRAANAGNDGNDKFFDAAKLRALKTKRAQIMRDMEQEAEMEGGPIADKYGDMLNKLDQAISMLSEDTLEEGASTEEKRIAMRAIKSIAKYRNVSNDEARNDLIRAANEIGDLKEGQLNENKEEALMELRNILDELQVLGDQAREIISMNFPSFLSQGEAYGAFDMGSSSNRYDTTLASIVADIEEYGDEEEDEDMMQEDLDLGHEDNEPHMLKADLYRIGKYAMELYQMLDKFEAGSEEVDLPHWWQSKIIKSKDAIVGAKHYLDFELKEPQIDAMVDVASEEEVIDEAAGKFVVRPCSNPGTPFAVWQTSKDGENDKRIEGFKTKEDAQKFADEKNSLNEGTWAVGSSKDIKSVMDALDQMMDLKNPKDIVRYLSKLDKFLYNTVGDDIFHDDIDGAKREAKEGNMDRAQNRLSDAYSRAAFFLERQMDREGLKEEEVNTRHIEDNEYMAAKIQKAMNGLDKSSEDYESKLYRLQQARKANNKGDFKTAMKIMKPFLAPVGETQYASLAEKLAKQLKSN